MDGKKKDKSMNGREKEGWMDGKKENLKGWMEERK